MAPEPTKTRAGSDSDSDGEAATPTLTPASPARPAKRASASDFSELPPSSPRETFHDDASEHSSARSGTARGDDDDGELEGAGGLGLVVAPLLPWVAVRIRYLGRPVVVTCLARAYLATLTFSATLDAVRFCAAGFLGPDRAYGVLEYQHGRWRQPMALRVVLRHERISLPDAVSLSDAVPPSISRRRSGASSVDGEGEANCGGADSGAEQRARGARRQVHRETFVASCYPEEGWRFLADSVESLELVVDPNFD